MSEFAPDVTEDGLHIDSYRSGVKLTTDHLEPPKPSAAVALDRAEEHSSHNLQAYVERFERWHGIKNR